MTRLALLLTPLALLLAGGLRGQLPADQQPVHEIRMTAKKYEFQPAELRITAGEKVRLLVTVLDRDHGLEIKAVGIKVKLKKGVETAVEFTATQPGEFAFQCANFCGLGHGGMKGKLIVEPLGTPE